MFSVTEKSLYVAALDLWIDSMRERDRCYVSHGHSDHAREHATVVTSVNNARVCRLRFGRKTDRAKQTVAACPTCVRPRREVAFEEHAFNAPWFDGEHRLTLFSAGHVLGSSQLLIEGEAGSFVYTGDFKLARSYTCEPPEVKKCDVAADGVHVRAPAIRLSVARRNRRPHHRLRNAKALEDGCAPMFFAYSLGKAQEAMAILAKGGIPITAHGAVHAMARVYEEAGVHLGPI